MNVDAVERHDARLRMFIKAVIERPVIGQGISLKQIDAFLKGRSLDEARKLVYHSLRYQKPITELLGIGELLSA